MYSDDEKIRLKNELKEMESFKTDVGSEGRILQDDLIEYIVNSNGDKDDLVSRIELYFYAFTFCQNISTDEFLSTLQQYCYAGKSAKIDRNTFFVYLNDSILDYEKINLIKKDLNKFDLEIEAVEDNEEILINLNFILNF